MIRTKILVLKELYHQHIVRNCGSYELLDATIGILMTPVADCDLRNYLDDQSGTYCKKYRKIETLSQGMGCLAAALSFIHDKGELHNDIHPSNILMSGGRLLYADFGFSRNTHPSKSPAEEFYSPCISCKRKVLHLSLMTYMLGVASANEPNSTWLLKSGKQNLVAK